ncbi:MAG: cation-translocating P-type ATPase [Firmicutes bacterium]|nr:cation-translocating P-type ATPase [Bacillota bacterium]
MKISDLGNLEQLFLSLDTDPGKGLSGKRRQELLAKHGANKLDTESNKSALLMLLSQFGDIMVLILLAATLVSAFLGEFHDALTILIIIILNAILGFAQEYKAERSLEALQNLTAPNARVLCNGEITQVPAESLVPGDIVFLRAGDKVPADIRIFDSISLEVEESPLTGETVPVAKSEKGEDSQVMAYMGCLVTRGRSSGIVVATGMKTKMGQIAGMMQHAQTDPTPLQMRLNRLGRVLVTVCVLISVFVAVAGMLRGEAIYKMFMAGVSLAVAAIPEGLPAVVTLCLAIGLQRMLRRKAIVRKLPAVETLGCATVICSDKTGTLTQNQMTVDKVYLAGEQLSVTGKGYAPVGEVLGLNRVRGEAREIYAEISALCNNSHLQGDKQRGYTIIGDPTDGALLVLARKFGVSRGFLSTKYEAVEEFPFDSSKKMMSTVVRHAARGHYLVLAKGAPDVILSRCSTYFTQRGVAPLGPATVAEIKQVNEKWANQAYRVIALAYKASAACPRQREQADTDLVFVGFAALDDPPRPEVASAVLACLRGGIRPVMITGDHKATALAIARRINLPYSQDSVITGAEIEALSDKALLRRVDRLSVCARVYPEHKMRLVRALKQRGHVVAMTGDGVNDAPAVKEANIGIAMGVTGTEVTKEAASLVLADDNFATIVAAVEEGRIIYDNIRKFIRFLLSCNAGEICTMFFAMLLGFPLPLRAIQILWVNLVTDGLPALALGMEPGSPGIMKRPPRPVDEGILARGMGAGILFTGLSIGVLTLMVFAIGLARGLTLEHARTMALSTLICVQLIYSLACRADDSGRAAPLSANMWFVGAIIFSFALLGLAVYNPVLQKVFDTVALCPSDWLLIGGASVIPLILGRMRRLLLPSR